MQLHTPHSLKRVQGLDLPQPRRSQGPIQAAFAWARNAARAWRTRSRARRDYGDLLAKPEHELRDMGLTHDEVLEALNRAPRLWRGGL